MNATRFVLWALAIVFLAFGLVALIQPEAMTGPPGLDSSAAGAVTEVRALYGGLQIGLGALLVWAVLDPSRWASGLMAYGLLLGAVGDCRFIGLLIDGNWTGFHLFALGFEWTTALLALFLCWRLRQPVAGVSEAPTA